MDYSSWSRYEAVPLSNGIMARRTGLHYLKSAEEICAYYRDHFGSYWFNELPKTDNTYSPTSKYYGCTLAPGIPLIPNLCRRPLRSNGDHGYDYQFSTETILKETLHHDSWTFKNNLINNILDNGTRNGKSYEHTTLLSHSEKSAPRRRVDFHDSGLDSDSDHEHLEEYEQSHSDNNVTWLRWIITTITTVITVITDTVLRRERSDKQNHVNNDCSVYTRVPLKQPVDISWYQYPVLWLYKLALLVQRVDVWLLYKVNSILRVDSWGTSQQRRKWALTILLIPILIWAGYKLVEWLWEEEPFAVEPLLTWLLSPFTTAWYYLAFCCTSACDLLSSWLTSAWIFLATCLSDAWFSLITWSSSAWGWFDGTWLWAPWITLRSWFQTSAKEDTEVADDTYVEASQVDWSFLYLPFTSLAALFTSLGGYIGTAASSAGECAVIIYSSVSDVLFAVLTWLIDCITSVPGLLSSALLVISSPFKSVSWGSPAAEYQYTPSAPSFASELPPTPTHNSASLEQLLADKRLLALLVRGLISSEEFNQALNARQSNNQAQVNSAVDSAFSAALNKIDLQFSKVKEELNEKISVEENSVESKMTALKQQIQDLQMALTTHKALVSEQAVFSNRLEARLSSSEQLRLQQDQGNADIKEQILLEVTKVKEELSEQLKNLQLNQVVVDSGSSPPSLPPSTDLEAFVNSTVERLLAVYDADKIAKVDYALASSGGSVLSVRCTETFSQKNAQYYLWGYPLWSKAANDPRIALQPGINPGECWAFAGSQGHLIIELSDDIIVTAFTLEHLPRSLSPSGTIDTAPKEFRVLGLESEQDEMPILLGRFRYEDNGASLQHFLALEVDHSFKIVELVVESNHGNLEYTCLYRFRVHGRPVRHSS